MQTANGRINQVLKMELNIIKGVNICKVSVRDIIKKQDREQIFTWTWLC